MERDTESWGGIFASRHFGNTNILDCLDISSADAAVCPLKANVKGQTIML